jgi:hypothetical protein
MRGQAIEDRYAAMPSASVCVAKGVDVWIASE